ncbi:MAG: hypothetical protein HYV40_05695 [Candidatus Levybacteria bacterium]|nr:hypothetical protein [Candidatus Levybacteria bacterium]
MNGKNHWIWRFVLFAFFGFTLVNLMFLNVVVLKDKQNAGPMQVVGSMQNSDDSFCDTDSCVPAIYDAIQQATSSQQIRTQPILTGQSAASGQTQEYYIALGTGTNSTSDWQDVGGAAAYVDSTTYGAIQTVTFEASAYIPTGNQTAYIRLFNKTAKHPVWFSDVALQGGQAQFLISSPITLDPGNNLYQVQMMTQLQYSVVLTQSRIHIISSN